MMTILLTGFMILLAVLGLGVTLGWKNFHYRTLSRDMVKWQRQGWVTSEGAHAILRDKRPAGPGARLVFLVGLLGAILLLFAAISFVAANWDDMSRLSRLTWLLVVLWMCFLAGWRLTVNQHPWLAEIAWMLGVGLFGVNIALIAQMFHIDSHPPNGVLMWTIGALVTAALLQSRAALVLCFAGAISWSLMETLGYGALVHWPFLILWGMAFGLTVAMRWIYTWHLAFLTMLTWAIVATIRFAADGHWPPHGVLSLFITGFLFLLAVSLVLQANRNSDREPGFEVWLEKYAILGLLPVLFGLQTLPFKARKDLHGVENIADQSLFTLLSQGDMIWLPATLLVLVVTLVLLFFTWREKLLRKMDLFILTAIALGTLAFALVSIRDLFFADVDLISRSTHKFLATWIYGAAFLAVLVWLMEFGHRRGSELYVWAALLAFAGEVLYIYFDIFGSLLETSLFFLVGGLLTMGLAFFLYHLHKRLDPGNDPAPRDQSIEGTK